MRRPSHRKHNAMWPRRRDRGVTTFSATEILKDLWPQSRLDGSEIWERPWWAKLAYARHWIGASAYYATKPCPSGRRHPGPLSFSESPFFKLIKKTDWSAQP